MSRVSAESVLHFLLTEHQNICECIYQCEISVPSCSSPFHPSPFHVHLLCARHSAKSPTGIMSFHCNKVRLLAINRENPVLNRFSHLPKFTQLCGCKANTGFSGPVQFKTPAVKSVPFQSSFFSSLSCRMGALLFYVLLGVCKLRGCDV